MFHIKKVWRGKSLHPFESIEINLNSEQFMMKIQEEEYSLFPWVYIKENINIKCHI